MVFFKRKDDEAGSGDAINHRARGRRAARRDASVDPLDPLELAKKRARRRLIGAVALVLGAIVLLPMVFDSEPKNASDDLSVEIPSQNSSFNPAQSVPGGSSASGNATAPGATLPAATTPPAAQSALVPGAPLTAAESSAGKGVSSQPPINPPLASNVTPPNSSVAAPPASMATATPAQSSGTARSVAAGIAASSPPNTVKQDSKADKGDKATAKTPASGHNDDPRALAALEGKDLTPTLPTEHGADSFAVQIGAFSNADKVKEVRDRLQAAGLKPYTEDLSTAQGPRTRVRVGPFATHEAAETAREKVKGLGYDGSVVTL